jgi:nucleotide-binding universal stress UspA family protein
MEEHKNLIVVPWDFTPVASHALAHAVKISRMVGNEISLLHVVEKGISQKALAEKRVHFQRVAEENSKKYNIPLTWQISKGSIFHAIADFANEKEAGLVIMGTHGMKGMQKITGSWALKVMVKSKTPFIIVQDPPADMEKYRSIVFPVDFRVENKEKMKMAIFMGKYFDSKIFMFVAGTTDKGLAKKTKIHLNFAVK